MRRARGGVASAIVRFGLGCRLLGRLVAEAAALLLLYLRRVGSDSLEAKAGRGILVDVVGTSGRPRGASEPDLPWSLPVAVARWELAVPGWVGRGWGCAWGCTCAWGCNCERNCYLLQVQQL
jgi:hypothetical protein